MLKVFFCKCLPVFKKTERGFVSDFKSVILFSSFGFVLLQDECYQVRQIFAQKLHKALVKLLLPLEYMAIFALCAKDPVKERRAHARQCLLKNISIRREYIKQNPMATGKQLSKCSLCRQSCQCSHLWRGSCVSVVLAWPISSFTFFHKMARPTVYNTGTFIECCYCS